MRKFLILSLITISILMLTGCGSSDKKQNGASIDENDCKNCVFAFYTEEKQYGENGDILTEYTKDYTTLKDENGNQRKRFLGHILDKDGKILRGFACGIKEDKVFCIEGSKDGSTYESNKQILKKIYGEEKFSQYGSYIECYDDVGAIANYYGDVNVHDSDNCYVNSNGSMYCW